MAKNKKEENIREKILEATSELIAIKGVTNASLGDICKKIGISKGTLYYYYKSKEDIIFDIADIHLKKVTDDIFSWLNKIEKDLDASDIMKIVFEKIISAETRGKSHLYLISDAVTKSDAFRKKFKENYHEWRFLLEQGMQKTFNKNLNYKVLSHILLAMIDGFIIQNLVGVENIPYHEIFDFLVEAKEV